jgi:hypothetical protein
VSETRSPLVVLHHRFGDPSPLQANTARDGRARIPQATRGASAGPPGRSRHVTCGNNEDGQPEWSRRPGLDCGSRLTALDHQESTMTASRCCSAAPAPQPQPRKPAQMTLAAELNPHETELNPHEAVPPASRQGRSEAGFPRTGRSPPVRQLVMDRASHVACDLQRL